MKSFYLTLLALCLLTQIGSGQSLREIEFTTYGQYPVRDLEYSPTSALAIEQGAKAIAPITIKTHSLERLGPYKFVGANQIQFYNRLDKKLAATINIPETGNKWLLIFVRNPRFKEDPENQLKYLAYAFDDSRSNLPKNGLIFLNFSGQKLDGLLEDKRVSIATGESNSHRVQESLPINLWARSFDGEKLLPALIKTYRFQPDHRYLMIFFPPVLRGSVDLDVRLLTESVE